MDKRGMACSEPGVNPQLTEADLLVLDRLLEAAKSQNGDKEKLDAADQAAIERLQALNDAAHPDFTPTVFTGWDEKDLSPTFNLYVVQPYVRWAKSIVRHPTDVVFVTHLCVYFLVNVPSAVWLFRNFTWTHGILHAIFTLWCTGPFTLMMHQHIHQNGVLNKKFATVDRLFPYMLEPLMGHTFDSYYYHHIKHHHVEGNGPDDLSSTIRYQRDSVWHFLAYFVRFFALIWIELPLYFWRKNRPSLAYQALASEMASYGLMYFMTTQISRRASIFVLIIPFIQLRLGLMIGNWGQHALVDELEPDSDYRSSITLIDVPSNRFCFNDGYHTAHHLNPRRHWREHPVHFLQTKQAYSNGRALVFRDIDYLFLTVALLRKDYTKLAKCLVPMGGQIGTSQQEIADMLRRKTRQFTEQEIQELWKPSVHSK